MAVTKSSGNGYALYNGVKLPNIDSVWTDKRAYPYAYILKTTDEAVASGFFEPVYVFICSEVVYFHDSNNGECRTNGYPAMEFSSAMPFGDDEWGLPEQTNVSKYSGWTDALYSIVWSNHDVYDVDGDNYDNYTTYLAASDPIPLDGMNVIEWDGDTTGLESAEDGTPIYRVWDFVPYTGPFYVVWRNEDGGLELAYFGDTGEVIFRDGDSWQASVIVVSSDGTSSNLPVPSGLWFPSDGANVYTTLFAYPVSGDDGGDAEEPDDGGDDTGDTDDGGKEHRKIITAGQILIGQYFDEETRVTAVEVTSHSFSPSDEIVSAYEAETDGAGDNIFIMFSEPLHSISISNGTILESGANFAIINASSNCILTGKKYNHTMTTKRIENPVVLSEDVENVLRIQDATLVSAENVDSVAERCYNYLVKRETVNCRIVEKKGNETSVGDLVSVYTEYLGDKEGQIIKQTFGLMGGNIVKDTVIK